MYTRYDMYSMVYVFRSRGVENHHSAQTPSERTQPRFWQMYAHDQCGKVCKYSTAEYITSQHSRIQHNMIQHGTAELIQHSATSHTAEKPNTVKCNNAITKKSYFKSRTDLLIHFGDVNKIPYIEK